MVEDEAELEHAEQQQQHHGDDHRELDQALAALAGATGAPGGADGAGHRIGSMRMTLERSNVKLEPSPTNVCSGVT